MIGAKNVQPAARVALATKRVACSANSSKSREGYNAELALLLTMSTVYAAPAYADVDGAVSTAVESVKAAGEVLKAGKAAAEEAAATGKGFYEKVSPTVNEYIDKASPIVKKGYEEASKVVVPFAQDLTAKGVPIVTEGTKSILKSSGVDVDGISTQATAASKTVQEASTVAAPTVNKVVNFLTTSSPETLGKIFVVLVAVYYLTPFAIKAAVSSFRGYSGEITPARAVDLVASDSSVAIIDVRPLKEKAAVGVPDVPSSARGRFIELEIAEIDRRLRGQLRNVDGVEAQVTALEIQALKRVNKGTKILLLDKNGGGSAKAIAKELAKIGFGNCFVISGGFQGWTSSKLQVKAPVGSKLNGAGFGDLVGSITSGTRRIGK